MSRNHQWRRVGLCLSCGWHCNGCNQCKCEVALLSADQRRNGCPGADVRVSPEAWANRGNRRT